jgi:hypothetical protein
MVVSPPPWDLRQPNSMAVQRQRRHNRVRSERWIIRNWRSERIAAAEPTSATLSGKPFLRQQRQIASLRRNLTLGPTGQGGADRAGQNAAKN